MISFRQFEQVALSPPGTLMTVEFWVINRVQNEDGAVIVKTNIGKEMWDQPDLINDEGWETVKSKLTPKIEDKRKYNSETCREQSKIAMQNKKRRPRSK